MKGILFGGCSFTWGQGLYFYSNLPNLYNPKSIYEFKSYNVTKAQIRFKNTLYYPRLVANHFNTFEVVKDTNGGSEDENFTFFKNLFKNEKEFISSHKLDTYTYEDFDYIILQLSAITRNKFKFNVGGKEFSCIMSNENNSNIIEYMKLNNYTFDDCYEQFLNQQYDRLKSELMFYQNKGIKIKIILWFDDLLSRIESDEFFKGKLITLNYDNKIFNTIWGMSNSYDEMRIISDPHFDKIKFNDAHPSKLLHRVIADSVITSIENDLKL
jgi:hypothetical protein